MATWEPMASPSGRACEVRTKRCRWPMAAQMAATESAVIVIGGVRRLRMLFGDLLQQLFDAILVTDALVELKLHFRGAAQPQTLANLTAHEPRRAVEQIGRASCRERV